MQPQESAYAHSENSVFAILIEEIDKRFGLGDKAGALLAELLQIIFDHRTGGGVARLMARSRKQGMGDLFASWLDNPRARPIEPRQLERMLDSGVPAGIARRLGIEQRTTLAALCMMLPRLIGLLTRDGALPTSIPAEARAYLGGSEPICTKPDIVIRAEQTSHPDLTPSLGVFKWIALVVVLIALGFYLLHLDVRSRNPPKTTAPAAANSAPDRPR